MSIDRKVLSYDNDSNQFANSRRDTSVSSSWPGISEINTIKVPTHCSGGGGGVISNKIHTYLKVFLIFFRGGNDWV